jgi:hypothetical protein
MYMYVTIERGKHVANEIMVHRCTLDTDVDGQTAL